MPAGGGARDGRGAGAPQSRRTFLASPGGAALRPGNLCRAAGHSLRSPREASGGRTLMLAETNPEHTGRTATLTPEVLVGEVVMVDQPHARTDDEWLKELARQAAQRKPILPAWMLSGSDFRHTCRWIAAHYLHVSAYHAVRMPVYGGKLALRAPRGVWRFISGGTRWVLDLEGLPVRLAAVRREDAEQYLRLSRQRDGRVRLRTLIAASVAVLGVSGTFVLAVLAPSWAHWATLAGLVAAFGLGGARPDRPLVSRAVVPTHVQELTSNQVTLALSVLGLAGINQAVSKLGDKAIGFPAPITRDGPGWRADVDLPPGVTATEVIERREKLAGALTRPLGCVWPEGNAEVHPGRLVLWVGDQDMSKARKPAWPLLKGGPIDLFKPQPYGTDQRGRWVNLTLMFIAMVIGSIPRMGKTFALREALLIAALDPRAEIHAYDLKGTGDLSALGKVAHRYRAGEDDEDILYAVAAMRELRAELRRRARVIRDLPPDLCPENKVTPELATRRSLGLHPIVVGVDECQVWFEHPEYGAELEEICTDLVKRGPATGIVLILATQRPDAKSLPTAISANASTRFCLKVMGQMENDMVLGTSKYRNGVRATMFAWEDKGIGYFAGEGADARIVSTVFIDGPAANVLAEKARALRERAGRLTGHALGETPEVSRTAGHHLLDDILSVVPVAELRVWNETVVARLAELRPDAYDGWAPEQLTAALKPYGIEVDQIGRRVGGKTVNRRGITRAHVAEKVAERNRLKAAA
ncbi:cell division protein FtsK [Catenuloplanes indicus]|uniref:S-DNA-T family DNA segregation ATPase FtsK/SpoIIIE n=1 Tax=Catenuloplanes indicus TaxID=137267 RepID=A0AAE3W1Y5_9ACTN|nr:cell division protein FtsK [Catenuloplanes indicus]MDQ0367835.1 S-DNA-T family DNA segregation ATPase FtsK/SpoIIIE [Catenuloplanes indicus]